MVETAILEPEVAKRKFTAGVGTLGRSRHSVPGFPGVSWRVAEATFPTLKILVTGPPGPLFFLSLDCTNYDFDPPWIAVLDTNDEPLAWGPLQVFGRSYMHYDKGGKPIGMRQDITWYQDNYGMICQRGNLAYHEAHNYDNWLDDRYRAEGSLPSIIESSLCSFDLDNVRKNKGLRLPMR